MTFDVNIINQIRDLLTKTGKNIAVAESVTAGLLQAALASAEQASDFFEGGITAYNIDQKVRHLGIDRKKGEACNCVSDDIANEMALGAVRMFRSDWGISVTGYATPVEESKGKVFAYYSIASSGRLLKSERIELHNLKGEVAQLEYVKLILQEFNQLAKSVQEK